ncbi:MAG TPA: aminotransferase class IV [Steroidobacteraceae bacterium]
MAEPLPTCYVNGEYLPFEAARISPFDRGFLFGDGVYEVMPVYADRPFRFGAHTARLTRSLAAIHMQDPHTNEQWRHIFASLLAKNGSADQALYWQVTRGVERGRNQAPLPILSHTVFVFSAPLTLPSAAIREHGIACVTAPDMRWARCDIKAISLLANILLRELATESNAAETIMLRDGNLTEGSSSAVHVVIKGELRSPEQSPGILPSTTRGVVEELAARAGISQRAMPVSEAQLRAADEIWISSALREILPVTTLDGAPVGSGRPGRIWHRVYNELQQYKRKLSGQPW